MLECLRAYNDFLAGGQRESSAAVPVMATPWDVQASVAEIERSAAKGHRAVLFCGQPQLFGVPPLTSRLWDPIWSAAEDAELPISFHVGGGDLSGILSDPESIGVRTSFSRTGATYFLENSRCLADLTFGGICHRFPRLKFVSVESGAGWLPFVFEGFDWQWKNGGIAGEHPEYDLLPSEYFRRQIYGCFWFEGAALRGALDLYPDNILYETDFPHPTCMAPGPRSSAMRPRDYANRTLAGLPDATLGKVLHDNAARLYKLD
jgi:predicted TIM-barrel fold metal-dependent hydrolase